MKLHKLLPSQRGETIIEVLIATTVIASVLVGAFVVAQRSVISVRNGQEHSEMLQILQSQVELVRSEALAQNSQTTGVFAPGFFCMVTDAMGTPQRLNATDINCLTIKTHYAVSAYYDSGTQVFTFMGTWDSFNGGINKEVLVYKVHAGS